MMKYVRFTNGNVVIMPSHQTHSDICRIRSIGNKVISAGFLNLSVADKPVKGDIVKVGCWGKSESLGCRSLEEDSDYITKLANGCVNFGRYGSYNCVLILQKDGKAMVLDRDVTKFYYDATDFSVGNFVFVTDHDEENDHHTLAIFIMSEFRVGQTNYSSSDILRQQFLNPQF